MTRVSRLGIDNIFCVSKPLPSLAFQIMNAHGDLIDLKEAMEPEDRPNYDTMSEDEVQRTVKTALRLVMRKIEIVIVIEYKH